MQQCPDCGRVYDESEYTSCPYCNKHYSQTTYHIVYDSERGEALSLSGNDYEEFKKTHPEYK